MKHRWFAVFTSLLTLAGLADAQTTTFTATLDCSQVVGCPLCCDVGGSGHGTFVVDPSINFMNFDIMAFPGKGEEEAHIHGPAQPGQNAPILFTLPHGQHKVGIWNYPESIEPAIFAGLTYVDVHTLEGPGTIRGQILQEVPATPHLVLAVLLVLVAAGGSVWVRRS